MTALTIIACVVAWLVLGAGALIVAIRIAPSVFLEATDFDLSGLTPEKRAEAESDKRHGYTFSYRDNVAGCPATAYRAPDAAPLVAALAIVAWPLSVIFACGGALFNGATRSINAKSSLRAELEKELAAAKKEIDDLLARRP